MGAISTGPASPADPELRRHPRSTRMPSVAIYGDSGMGKTMIMEKFRLDHPADFDLKLASPGPPSLRSKCRESRMNAAYTLNY
jgi:hypothetical protein